MRVILLSFLLSSCGISNSRIGEDETSELDGVNYHTIVWLNHDHSLIYKDTKVPDGEKPVFKGEVPTKDSDAMYAYTFSGWSPEIVPAYVDATYVAQFSNTLNEYSVIWKDDDGSILSAQKYTYGSTPSFYMQNIPYKDRDGYRYTFKGWSPSIEIVTGDAVYNATYSRQTIEEALGIVPTIDVANNTVTYGLYPQHNVNNPKLLSSLDALAGPNSNGWYFYNNDYYVKETANTDQSGRNYKFDNGAYIVPGTTYWFKCEPITWNILNDNNGEFYLLSSVVLDVQRFNEFYDGLKDGHYPNNYKYSEIRSWLNNEFYNMAFQFNYKHIKTTIVDNSAATTDSNTNPYFCEDTEDKVFLSSYQDYLNTNYGFVSSIDPSNTRKCKATDWTRAKIGMFYDYIEYNLGYWTRSPYSGGGYHDIRQDHALSFAADGRWNANRVEYDLLGTRPAITFSLTE